MSTTKKPAVKKAAVKKAAVKKAAVKKAAVKKAAMKKAAATGPDTVRGANDKQAFPVMPFATVEAWEGWLEANHATAKGVWLKLAKKGSGVASIDYPQALDGALAWGWIDGLKKGFDATWWIQKFTPRSPKSIWSKINRDKIDALSKAGKMKHPGLTAVERAKKDGRWAAAYDSQRTSGVPEDLQRAIDADAKAKAFYATLSSANRYAITFRVQTAKKAETRAKNIAKFVEMLARGQTIHPQKVK